MVVIINSITTIHTYSIQEISCNPVLKSRKEIYIGVRKINFILAPKAVKPLSFLHYIN